MKKRIFVIALIFIILFSLLPNIYATSDDFVKITFGTMYEAIITDQTTLIQYRLTVSTPGRVTLNISNDGMENPIDGLTGSFRTNSGKVIKWLGLGGYINNLPYDAQIDLDSGVYYLWLDKASGGPTGAYKIWIDYIAAGYNINELNNDYPNAQQLSSGQSITGFVTVLEPDDYYKVDLSLPGRVTLGITNDGLSTPIDGLSGSLRDNSGNVIKWIGPGGYITSLPCDFQIDLDPGTYFIIIAKLSGGLTGAYNITMTLPSDQQTPQTYNITTIASPTNGGSVSGGGTYQHNASVKLTAKPNIGWTFDGWYEDSVSVNINAIYTFAITTDRTLEARFIQEPAIINDTVSSSPEPTPNPDPILATPPTPIPDVDENINNDASSPSHENSITIDNGWIVSRDWGEIAIYRAVELDLIPDALNRPGMDFTKPINRMEFAGVAVRAYEHLSSTQIVPIVPMPFIDTNDMDVQKAYAANIMIGYSDTEFEPLIQLNREQAATALSRVFKRYRFPEWTYATDANFSLTYTRPAPFDDDIFISEWARDSVYFMVANDIILGIGNNLFAPSNRTTEQEAEGYATATREQALAIAVRMADN